MINNHDLMFSQKIDNTVCRVWTSVVVEKFPTSTPVQLRPKTANRVVDFLAKHQVVVIDHPPYSPDVSPADFFLFPRLKGVLKGVRFSSVEEIQRRVTAELRAIPKEAFAEGFQQLYSRCQKCIVANGDYFEGQ